MAVTFTRFILFIVIAYLCLLPFKGIEVVSGGYIPLYSVVVAAMQWSYRVFWKKADFLHPLAKIAIAAIILPILTILALVKMLVYYIWSSMVKANEATVDNIAFLQEPSTPVLGAVYGDAFSREPSPIESVDTLHPHDNDGGISLGAAGGLLTGDSPATEE